MNTTGLLGGMSWESTVGYYQAINQGIRKELGGLHSAEIIMASVDFPPWKDCSITVTGRRLSPFPCSILPMPLAKS